jgi:alkylation response protein AidB-like acyl-CoA dehydrogenase
MSSLTSIHPVTVLERVRALAETLAPRAAEVEETGQLPADIADAVAQAGLHRILQPAKYGGDEGSILTHDDVVALLARACTSTAWVTSVWGMHNWMLALFPEAAQEEVWQRPGCLTQASFAPLGRAGAVPGGYRLSGRWPFASGIDQADWSVLAAMVTEPGADTPSLQYLIVPRADVTVHDTWQVSGLRGTGSKDVAVEDVFVPAHRVLAARDATRGQAPGLAVHGAALYRNPLRGMLIIALLAPAVGAAEGAVEAFTGRMRQRTIAYSGKRQAELGPARIDLAEADVCAHTARLLMERVGDELQAAGERGGSEVDEARAARDCSFALRLATRAVDVVMAASGGGALHLSSPIQRYWRDVHAVAAHAALNWQTQAEAYAASVLDGAPQS